MGTMLRFRLLRVLHGEYARRCGGGNLPRARAAVLRAYATPVAVCTSSGARSRGGASAVEPPVPAEGLERPRRWIDGPVAGQRRGDGVAGGSDGAALRGQQDGAGGGVADELAGVAAGEAVVQAAVADQRIEIVPLRCGQR